MAHGNDENLLVYWCAGEYNRIARQLPCVSVKKECPSRVIKRLLTVDITLIYGMILALFREMFYQ